MGGFLRSTDYDRRASADDYQIAGRLRMRRVTALIRVLAVLPLSAALRQTAPQATPKFKSGVELVVLDVSALDEKRQPVRGLSGDDFTVLEDGKPQAIACSRRWTGSTARWKEPASTRKGAGCRGCRSTSST
jgi:hypothetical protein